MQQRGETYHQLPQKIGGLVRKQVVASRTTTVLFCTLLLLSGTPMRGQQTLRDLSGSVQDGHHEPLRGAVVYLESEATHNVMTFITDRSGHFSFKRLHGDVDYDVWAIYRGQDSKRKTLSQFDTHPTPQITLVIKPE